MTNRLKLIVAVAAVSLSLISCSPITLAPMGSYAVGKSPTVTLDRPWNDMTALWLQRSKKARLLTLDGPELNRLYLTEGLIEGDYIVRPTRREATTPIYSDTMSVTEQVEFVADSITAIGYERVETSGVRPTEIASARAVRFLISARTTDGLDIKGVGQVLKRDEKFYVAIYLAPAEHYFEASRPSAEAAMTGLAF